MDWYVLKWIYPLALMTHRLYHLMQFPIPFSVVNSCISKQLNNRILLFIKIDFFYLEYCCQYTNPSAAM
jgi:hypothetical protein